MSDPIRQLLRRGTAAFEAGNYAEAEALLLRVVEQRTDYANVYHMLGVIAGMRGLRAAALVYFRRALDVNPEYREAQLNLAIMLVEGDASAEALEEASRLHTQEPVAVDDLDPVARGKLANAHAELARMYHLLGLYADALGEFDKALALCPNFPDIHHRRAASCRARGDLVGAADSLSRALELHPRYVEAHVRLGQVYRQMGLHDEAIATWGRALEIDPDHALARVSLARARASQAGG